MSFMSNVQGLDKLPVYLDGSMRGSAEYTEYLDTFETTGTRACINYYGEAVECPGPALESKSWSMPLNIPVKPDADYYAFSMYIAGPQLRGAGCHTPIAPTDGPCGGAPSDSHYEGAFDLDGWVIAPGPQSVPPTFEADSHYPPENNGNSQVNWPVDEAHGTHAYLVNPSPGWPVPDASGNEFGMVLFDSLGDLPGAITLDITHYNRYQAVGSRWHMSITAYELTGPPPVLGPGYRGAIIHYA